MKREDLKALGLDDAQIDAVMKQHGRDIQAEQARTADAQTKLAAYDGVDVKALQQQVADLTAKNEAIIFNGKVKDAITAAGGRSVKAISALMDLDALKSTKEGQEDAIKAAVDQIKASDGWAFTGTETQPAAQPHTTVATGAEHGTGGSDSMSGVEKAFRALNAGLKIPD